MRVDSVSRYRFIVDERGGSPAAPTLSNAKRRALARERQATHGLDRLVLRGS